MVAVAVAIAMTMAMTMIEFIFGSFSCDTDSIVRVASVPNVLVSSLILDEYWASKLTD